MLKFSSGKNNAKLVNLAKVMGNKKVYTFSTMSGYTCPAAKECLSKVVETNGKYAIKDGPYTLFRCFSATQEAVYPAVRRQRQHNMQMLLSCLKDKYPTEAIFNMFNNSIPKDAGIIRINVAGDIFNQSYFDALIKLAIYHPTVIFYAYTKSLNFWVRRLSEIPNNFILTASYGGKYDDLIAKHNLRYAKVVFSEKEANDLGLEIDHDDSFAAKIEKKNISFALLLHGVQPKGSDAAVALKELKGKGSYSHKKKDSK